MGNRVILELACRGKKCVTLHDVDMLPSNKPRPNQTKEEMFLVSIISCSNKKYWLVSVEILTSI